MADRRHLTILIVPEDGRERTSFRVSYRSLGWLSAAVVSLGLILALMAGSWWYFAARGSKALQLEQRVAGFEAERERVMALAAELEELEASYERMRAMFGADGEASNAALWLPPVGAAAGSRTRPGAGGEGVPSAWPLTERGFITQGLLEGLEGESQHPGLDIAVPSGAYVRAAAAGVVRVASDDPIYGLHLIIDHDDGYATLYGHASSLLVQVGDTVSRNEVVALTGSTGRSTAPHLHFEILRDGLPLDPLTLVRQP